MEDLPFFIFCYTFTVSVLLDISFAVDAITQNHSISDVGRQTLVSSGGSFELGFFSPGSSKSRYLGLWYKNIPSPVVWVANRNNPITDSSGVLKIGSDGNIVLVNGTENVVWSSNSSIPTLVNPIALLLDSGNLVLRDERSSNSDTHIWQSFDYPCDTLLPGMKHGWSLKENKNWSLSSWKSIDDPSPGDFIYSVDHVGLPQFVLRKGSEIQFRSGNYDGARFGGDPEIKITPVFKPKFVFNPNEVYYTFEDIYPTITRFVLNQSGSIDHLKWNDESREWIPLITLHRDNCDNYAACGANAACNINDTPMCHCLKGFTPKSPQESIAFDLSAGCIRSSPLNCSKGEGFEKFTRMKLPDKSEVLNTSNRCDRECLARCSCTAYAVTAVTSCAVWFGDLVDIREYIKGGATDLYIRMAANELDSNSKKMKIIIVSVVLGTFLLGSISWFIIWKKRRANRGVAGIHISNQDRDYTDKSQEEDLELHIFDFATIAAATNNFSFANKIGEGGFGPVYKGQLSTGQEIAVKTLAKDSGQGINEFKNEVMLIAKLQHRNLVRILGCCIQGEDRMLIYEYMPNKSLDTFIFDKTRGISLNWRERFDIIVGIARGLLYLHQDSRLRIVHRDLKASNILLDGNMNPKISDFGAAKTFIGDQTEANTKRVVGTYGYMSPEYAIDGLFSMKSDVFSYGVIVLEIVSGKKNRGFYHPDHDLNLLGHVWKLWNEGKALELMDEKMETPVPLPMSEVLRCIHVGLLCVQQRPVDRPTMSSVVLMLGSDTATLPQPKQPGFSTESYLWQSFDYPCDTLLPGMKLGWSSKETRNWSLSSWKNADDPSPGDFTYGIDPGGLPQIVLRKGSKIQFRSGNYDGVQFGGEPELKITRAFKPIFIFKRDEVYYTFEDINPAITRFVLSPTGSPDHFKWNDGSRVWVTIFTSHRDNCDTYAACGAHGICNIIDSRMCKCLKGFTPKSPQEDYTDEGQEEDLELHIFGFATIEAATNNFAFANKIGEGGFGPVYKGQLSMGQEIAVKRLAKDSGQGITAFKSEVMLIAKLQHRNLVRLLGCCIQGEERMLIYEYMPNKSLDAFIFDKRKDISLNWRKRFDIIVGIARGLLYLHQDSRLRIIHRDLKASNILLDSDMNPKISDFGAAKTFRGDQTEANTKRVVGTYGYMSPEYAIDGLFSMKSDIFSFGVVVLEIVSGKKNRGFYHPDHDLNLLGHVWKLWNEGKALELMDAKMETPFPLPMSEVLRCIHVGLLCVQQRPEDRPTMSSVVLMLASDTATLPKPKQPGFSTERFLTDLESSSCDTGNELTVTAFEVDTIAPDQSIRGNQTLVSAGGSFELGFFTPGNSRNQYLGMWFKVMPSTVVWVANRNEPITDSSGVLKISTDGNIVLLNGTEDVVWSSNSSRRVVNPVAQLLETGNLVLRDESSSNSDSYTWQSFDYPCDTLLPGMKIGWSLKAVRNWSLSSWKNSDDPSPGDFTYSVDPRGLPQLVLRKGSEIQFRSGPWDDGTRFGEDAERQNSIFKPMVVFNKDEVYYIFENKQKSTISRFLVNQSGTIQHFRWNDVRHEWVPMITLHRDNCDNYAACGAYGACNIIESPNCKCLKGFTPKSPQEWNVNDPSAGCIRRSTLGCKKGEGFVKFTRVKLPDKSQILNTSTECERECLTRCSCMAYAKIDVISNCAVWLGDDLIDIREYSEDSSDKKKLVLTITLVSVVFVIFLLGSISWFIIWKKRTAKGEGKKINNQDRDYHSQEINQERDHTDESREEDLELHIFEFLTIAAATNNFSFANKIGEGGFGPVYKGQLLMGQEIAVKRLAKDSGQGINEFKNEVMLIAKLQHRNLVRLLGCCIQGEERMLIYEYMPNKSLDTFIFDKTRGISLNWGKRLDIIMGIARGVLYLHQDSRLRIVHRDLKASNILLDGDMNPKISDFGAAKTFIGDQTEANTKRVVGTYGYMSPEYAIDGLFSIKSDVFSFGVLVLEIVSGKKNRGFYHPDHDLNLLGHVWKLWNEGKASELMDENMETPVPLPLSEVLRCIHVGLLCVQQRPENRPTMSSVVLMLGSDTATLPQPKQPGFSTERFLIDNESSSSEKKLYTGNEITLTTLEGR
ncbi:Protein kinase domain [Macleaya cordata]|uniref:non-specific serine/threonine protein kinase n=1 Tax=Macleaya cordata TaxID=56857 RepID=A0A200Q0W5_MACCD|nr:Protein kinase domain [Macleaya cordata]